MFVCFLLFLFWDVFYFMLVLVSCYSDLSVAAGLQHQEKKIELGDRETLHNVEVAERPLCYKEYPTEKQEHFLSERKTKVRFQNCALCFIHLKSVSQP